MNNNSLRSRFPRLLELAEFVDHSKPGHYFADFETVVSRPDAPTYYEQLEGDLQQLSSEAWSSLLKKCAPYVCTTRGKRGWDQLFTTLDERKGYLHLRRLGYHDIKFYEENSTPTPDIVGTNSGRRALVEVKTLQRSDQALSNIYVLGSGGRATFRDVPKEYSPALGDKFKGVLKEADEQLSGGGHATRRIAYLILEPDDSIYSGPRLEQVQGWIHAFRPPDVEVVLECKGLTFSAWPRAT